MEVAQGCVQWWALVLAMLNRSIGRYVHWSVSRSTGLPTGWTIGRSIGRLTGKSITRLTGCRYINRHFDR
jgi:hypothetical protein